MWICKHCNKNFDNFKTSQKANHSRWCSENPKHAFYKANSNGSQLNTLQSISKRSIGISEAHKAGKYKESSSKRLKTKILNGTLKHSEETRNKMSVIALGLSHRRMVRSTRIYTKKDGTNVLLDSSWEESLAKRLDHLNVLWERPGPIKWTDSNNKDHNYFPDFYLPHYDLYLDPKNNIVYNSSIEKINILQKNLPNLLIIRSLKECEEFDPDHHVKQSTSSF